MSGKGKRSSAAAAPTGSASSASSAAAASAEKPQVDNPVPPAASAAAAAAKPKPVDWYAKLLDKKPNFYKNLKFDPKHPMDPTKNNIRLRYDKYKEPNTAEWKQTARVEWTGREHLPPFYNETGDGTLPANIISCLFTLGTSRIKPFGNYAGSNPSEREAKFITADMDKVSQSFMCDGYAPHLEWADPADTKKVKRDRHFLEMMKKGEQLMEWAVRYVLMDKAIKTKFKVDVQERFPNDLNKQVQYILGKANGVLTKKKDAKGKTRAEMNAANEEEKSTIAMTDFFEEDSERMFFNRNLIPKPVAVKDAAAVPAAAGAAAGAAAAPAAADKKEKPKSNGIVVTADPFEVLLQQKGRHIWHLNVWKVRYDGKEIKTELDLNHPFRTATKDPKTQKWRPLTESQKHLCENTVAMCEFNLSFYLDGQKGIPMGARRMPLSLTTFGLATNARPLWGAKPSVNAEDQKAMNEDADVIAALKESARQEEELLKNAQEEEPEKTPEEQDAEAAANELKKAEEEAGGGVTDTKQPIAVEEPETTDDGPPSPATVRIQKQLEEKKAKRKAATAAAAAASKSDEASDQPAASAPEEKASSASAAPPPPPPKVRATQIESVSAKELEDEEETQPSKKRARPAAAAVPEEAPPRARATAPQAAASEDEPRSTPPARARATAAATPAPAVEKKKAPAAAAGGKAAARKPKPSDLSSDELSGF